MSGLLERPVSAVMKKAYVTAKKEQPIGEIIELMVSSGASFIPVLDDFKVVAGTISERDLSKVFNVQSVPGAIIKISDEPIQAFLEKPAKEVMTAQPITLEETSPVSDAVRIFANNHIHVIPVVNRGGVIVGVVNLLDILSHERKAPCDAGKQKTA